MTSTQPGPQTADGGGAVTAAGPAWLVPGEMAARVDRLPMSLMAWEMCLIVQLGWSASAATSGIARTLYPFLWLPHHDISSSEYSVLFALQTGISVLVGGYFLGWLSDKIGRRKILILSSLLAAVFIWPFGYVTSFPALLFLSIGGTLGFAGYLAVNVVYMTETTGPAVRGKVIMGAQAAALGIGLSVLTGLIPHYLIPGHYRAYLWLLAGLNLLAAAVLFWRLPESPRWLEARGRRDQSRKVVKRMEARVMDRHPVLPEPDLTPYQVVAEKKTGMFAVFGKQYLAVTVLLLLVMVLGYGGITYGNTGYSYLFLAENRGYGAGFIFALSFWAGVASAGVYLLNALLGDRIERRYAQLLGAIVFAGAWYGIYNVHNTPALVALFIAQETGVVLWLWSMYVYIPNNFPTRMRSLGTGWTDGVGHLGAWGGVLLAGQVFVAAAPLGWILLITIPGALIPALMIAIFGKRQHRRVLEELAR